MKHHHKSGIIYKSEGIFFREIDLFLYFTKILCEVDIGINQFHEKKFPPICKQCQRFWHPPFFKCSYFELMVQVQPQIALNIYYTIFFSFLAQLCCSSLYLFVLFCTNTQHYLALVCTSQQYLALLSTSQNELPRVSTSQYQLYYFALLCYSMSY